MSCLSKVEVSPSPERHPGALEAVHRPGHACGVPPRYFTGLPGAPGENRSARLDRNLADRILRLLVAHTRVPFEAIARLTLGAGVSAPCHGEQGLRTPVPRRAGVSGSPPLQHSPTMVARRAIRADMAVQCDWFHTQFAAKLGNQGVITGHHRLDAWFCRLWPFNPQARAAPHQAPSRSPAEAPQRGR